MPNVFLNKIQKQKNCQSKVYQTKVATSVDTYTQDLLARYEDLVLYTGGRVWGSGCLSRPAFFACTRTWLS